MEALALHCRFWQICITEGSGFFSVNNFCIFKRVCIGRYCISGLNYYIFPCFKMSLCSETFLVKKWGRKYIQNGSCLSIAAYCASHYERNVYFIYYLKIK
jgi:hypothetical protein